MNNESIANIIRLQFMSISKNRNFTKPMMANIDPNDCSMIVERVSFQRTRREKKIPQSIIE